MGVSPQIPPQTEAEKKEKAMILDRSTLISDDVVSVAQFLLGKRLMTSIDGAVTGGMIIETEAYKGPEDRACHAYGNRRTKRTEVMFHKGGDCVHLFLLWDAPPIQCGDRTAWKSSCCLDSSFETN